MDCARTARVDNQGYATVAKDGSWIGEHSLYILILLQADPDYHGLEDDENIIYQTKTKTFKAQTLIGIFLVGIPQVYGNEGPQTSPQPVIYRSIDAQNESIYMHESGIEPRRLCHLASTFVGN